MPDGSRQSTSANGGCRTAGEQMSGPLFCEVAIARQTPIEADMVDNILDEIVGPSLREYGALPFETLTGVFEAQPYQFVGPLQEFPALAPTRYLLLTHWPTNDALQAWLRSGVIEATFGLWRGRDECLDFDQT